ncbi:hypothetical protein [Streptomyces bauhiniae]|uniref:hypothetical protein n=1 Tax=Streptomyces bauhiniae TaxID=2340725 RepID=UPI00364EBE24
MTTNAKIGTALVGGYLLGRTKKAKLAIGLGMFLAGKKLSLDPRQLGRLVADTPVLKGLTEQVRHDLLDATRSAAGTALTNRVNHLAASLGDRARALGEPESHAEDEAPQDDADDSQPADEAPAEPRRRTRTSAGTKAKKTASATGGAARRTGSSRGAGSASAGGQGSTSKSRTAKAAARGAKSAAGSRPARKQREESDRG